MHKSWKHKNPVRLQICCNTNWSASPMEVDGGRDGKWGSAMGKLGSSCNILSWHGNSIWMFGLLIDWKGGSSVSPFVCWPCGHQGALEASEAPPLPLLLHPPPCTSPFQFTYCASHNSVLEQGGQPTCPIARVELGLWVAQLGGRGIYLYPDRVGATQINCLCNPEQLM